MVHTSKVECVYSRKKMLLVHTNMRENRKKCVQWRKNASGTHKLCKMSVQEKKNSCGTHRTIKTGSF